MTHPTHIRLRITCEAAPPATYTGQPTEFGLQDKQQTLHPGAALPDGALQFACELAVKTHAATGAPNFSGPLVHGPAGGRFLYLSWRPIGGAWISRYKIPLASITWELIASGQAHPLTARVSAARTGTVALLGAGWRLEIRE